jgi:hypothetical protein
VSLVETSTTVKTIQSDAPSATQIATVTKDAASVVSSVKSFMDASGSTCS